MPVGMYPTKCSILSELQRFPVQTGGPKEKYYLSRRQISYFADLVSTQLFGSNCISNLLTKGFTCSTLIRRVWNLPSFHYRVTFDIFNTSRFLNPHFYT